VLSQSVAYGKKCWRVDLVEEWSYSATAGGILRTTKPASGLSKPIPVNKFMDIIIKRDTHQILGIS
jgi:hypothetical protein